jgi:hypothetical protein
MDWNELMAHPFVAHALLRAATALVPSQGIKKIERSHECERGTQECVRHVRKCGSSVREWVGHA